ncbi:MAG: hypothetical protein L0228_03810 [Planctomycetes bacterium]|nr:hypothetical protein [Planctomycetota bacterium]
MDRIVRSTAGRWAAAIVALAAIGIGDARGDDDNAGSAKPRAAEREQVVVLHDGGVLVGRVTRSGDRYVLARGGGEVQIRAANVMLVAASLEDAYQQRRQQLSRPTAEAHLGLAEWCLQHDLFAHAEQELADARALDARNAKLVLLERRLALVRERRPKPVQHTDVRATREPESENAQLALSQQTDVSELPAGAVERFTRKVQPVLVNNCTTAGCHQPGGAEKFQLDRAMLRGLSNRHTTMSNLAATLTLVDRENPQLSLLLTIPRRTHGDMKGPIFGPRQEPAFRHLAEWVALVTEETSKPSPDTTPADSVELVAAEESANGTAPSRWASPVMREERQSLYQEPASQDVSVEKEAAPDAAKGKPSIRYGAQLERWHPRDPFDPEIFNRGSAMRGTPSRQAKAVSTPSDEQQDVR